MPLRINLTVNYEFRSSENFQWITSMTRKFQHSFIWILFYFISQHLFISLLLDKINYFINQHSFQIILLINIHFYRIPNFSFASPCFLVMNKYALWFFHYFSELHIIHTKKIMSGNIEINRYAYTISIQ